MFADGFADHFAVNGLVVATDRFADLENAVVGQLDKPGTVEVDFIDSPVVLVCGITRDLLEVLVLLHLLHLAG
ncbi:hypothetical protein FRC0505_02471 [Corynebacterium diphtheriae]|nr:hypothetical protein FRC0024_02434 [Corynebacterium diphtheriae]CAB0867553.1 hypothetical protein FRC0314_02404 [Corynebacterium diphtheriae]CAB1018181.1 hypothetical protein FRC0505_02471 [Corynebacterium diphtheriae]